MNEELIEKLAKEAGFDKDQYSLYWDQDSNSEGVDLEKFAEVIVRECGRIANEKEEGFSEYDPDTSVHWYILKHFGINNG